MAGVVASSRHRSGPRGRYAYLYLSDPNGIYETAIFDASDFPFTDIDAGQTLNKIRIMYGVIEK